MPTSIINAMHFQNNWCVVTSVGSDTTESHVNALLLETHNWWLQIYSHGWKFHVSSYTIHIDLWFWKLESSTYYYWYCYILWCDVLMETRLRILNYKYAKHPPHYNIHWNIPKFLLTIKYCTWILAGSGWEIGRGSGNGDNLKTSNILYIMLNTKQDDRKIKDAFGSAKTSRKRQCKPNNMAISQLEKYSSKIDPMMKRIWNRVLLGQCL